MMYLFALLALLGTSAFAYDWRLSEEELNPTAEDVLLRRPEKHQRSEAMIYDLNTELGIKDQRRFTGNDWNRISFAGHLSSDYEHFTDILGIEAAYMRRSARYDRIWWALQFFNHRTYFDAIAENSADASGGAVPNNSRTTVMAGGAGVGYRFRLLLDFWPLDDVFENVDVFVNYLTLNESFFDRSYRGYGLTANYGIHKRSGVSFFYGGKISYNFAAMRRGALNNEPVSQRSFAIGWLSLALEFGYYY
jgi:hypothetical protein